MLLSGHFFLFMWVGICFKVQSVIYPCQCKFLVKVTLWMLYQQTGQLCFVIFYVQFTYSVSPITTIRHFRWLFPFIYDWISSWVSEWTKCWINKMYLSRDFWHTWLNSPGGIGFPAQLQRRLHLIQLGTGPLKVFLVWFLLLWEKRVYLAYRL